jgi:hypothetical protein
MCNSCPSWFNLKVIHQRWKFDSHYLLSLTRLEKVSSFILIALTQSHIYFNSGIGTDSHRLPRYLITLTPSIFGTNRETLSPQDTVIALWAACTEGESILVNADDRRHRMHTHTHHGFALFGMAASTFHRPYPCFLLHCLPPATKARLSYFCLLAAQDSGAFILLATHKYGGCVGKSTLVKNTVLKTRCRSIVQPLTTSFIGTNHGTYTYLLLPMLIPLGRLYGR